MHSPNNFSFISSAVTKHEERDICCFEYLSPTTITFAFLSTVFPQEKTRSLKRSRVVDPDPHLFELLDPDPDPGWQK
jgi:hypothetical protein